MNGTGKLVILGLLVVIVCSVPLPAQEEASTAGAITQDVDLIEDHLRVSIMISQRREDVTAPMDVHVHIVNRSDKDITLKKVDLLMPAEFLAARGENQVSSGITRGGTVAWQSTHTSGKLLNTRGQQFISFRIPEVKAHWYSPVIRPRLLTFFPDEYDIWVELYYEFPGQEGDTVIAEILKIQVKPPLISLLWGGVIGAALLGLFISTYRYHRDSPQSSLRNSLQSAFTFFASGAISALIAILLLHRIGDLQLPVVITVHDFYGSVVIGLFTYKIGDWLNGLFFGDTSHPSQVSGNKGNNGTSKKNKQLS